MLSVSCFSDLIAPTSVEHFFQTYWEKTHLHIRRDQADYYDPVLTLSDLDEFFQNQELPATFMKVTKSGTTYLPEQWMKLNLRREFHALHVVDVEKLLALHSEGATIVISGGHKSIPKLTQFASKLEHELKFALQMNIYITPPQSQGLHLHYDAHDVLVMQISGQKQWNLYDIPQRFPTREQRFRRDQYVATQPKQSLELQPGDLLYLPRGLVHDAHTSETTSIHITLALLPNYWFDVLNELVTMAKDDPEFRQALPHGLTSSQDKATAIAAISEKLKRFVSEADIAAVLDRQTNAFVEDQLLDRQGRFADNVLMAQLSSASIVCKRSSTDYLISKSNQQITIAFGKKEISLPEYLETTLQLILQDQPFTIRDIEGLITEQGKLALIEKFVRVGLLKIIKI